jgi:hypothetical protein
MGRLVFINRNVRAIIVFLTVAVQKGPGTLERWPIRTSAVEEIDLIKAMI